MKYLSRLLRDENLYLCLLCIPMMFAILRGSKFGIAHVDSMTLKIGIAILALFLTLKMTWLAALIIQMAKNLYRMCVRK